MYVELNESSKNSKINDKNLVEIVQYNDYVMVNIYFITHQC